MCSLIYAGSQRDYIKFLFHAQKKKKKNKGFIKGLNLGLQNIQYTKGYHFKKVLGGLAALELAKRGANVSGKVKNVPLNGVNRNVLLYFY